MVCLPDTFFFFLKRGREQGGAESEGERENLEAGLDLKTLFQTHFIFNFYLFLFTLKILFI